MGNALASPGPFANWRKDIGCTGRAYAGALKAINLISSVDPRADAFRARIEASQRLAVRIEAKDKYFDDMPPQVISIVQSTSSASELKQLLQDIAQQILCFGAKIDPAALPSFERIALLFGFEHSSYELLDSLGSIFKNMQVSDADKDLIASEIYEATTPYTVGDAATRMLYALNDIPQDPEHYTLDWRIKQYRSLTIKLEGLITKIRGAKPLKPLSVKELLRELRKYGPIISADPTKYLDELSDLVGLGFIINDTCMEEAARTHVLTFYANMFMCAFKPFVKQDRLRVFQERKESRVPGFEKVNIYVQGWLHHPVLGNLPIKIQLRFQRAMLRESAMYYAHKYYDRWELPPWAEGIDFDKISSQEEVEEALYLKFKEYFRSAKPGKPFRVADVLTPSKAWAPLFKWQ